MKSKMCVAIVLVVLGMLVIPTAAMKFKIDGDPSDWGITPSDIQRGLNERPNSNPPVDPWIPFYPNMHSPRWVVEDDVDPAYESECPHCYDFGAHYQGYGNTYWVYHEPKVDGRIQPSPSNGTVYGTRGDDFDVEALYLDEDNDYIYIFAVVSTPPEGLSSAIIHYPKLAAGDLAIDLDGPNHGGYGYEYGVRLGTWDPYNTGAVQFGIYKTDEDSDWYPGQDLVSNSPVVINTSKAQLVGMAIGSYINASEVYNIWESVRNLKTGGYDNKSVFFIELAIPKTTLGVSGNVMDHYIRVFLSEAGCGNDAGSISIPEFTTILIPVGLVLVVVLAMLYRKE